jgi:hypothetical protein
VQTRILDLLWPKKGERPSWNSSVRLRVDMCKAIARVPFRLFGTTHTHGRPSFRGHSRAQAYGSSATAVSREAPSLLMVTVARFKFS